MATDEQQPNKHGYSVDNHAPLQNQANIKSLKVKGNVLLSQNQPEPRENSPKIIDYLQAVIRFANSRIANLDWLSAKDASSALSPIYDFSYAFVSPFQPYAPETLPENDPFDTFEEAFQHFKHQVLLLGPPGAGKTTSILMTLRTAAQERLDNPSAPIPLLAYVNNWKPGNSIVAWVRCEKLNQNVPMTGEAVLYLLDGLDELGAERPENPKNPHSKKIDPRALFILSIQEQLGDAKLVITCRERDYFEIGRKLALKGAVCLLPMQLEKIERILIAAGQTELYEAIKHNESLLKLVQSPLILALLRGITAENKLSEQQLAELNETKIFDLYISGRFHHERSKQASKPVDLQFEEIATRNIIEIIAVQMMESSAASICITLQDIALAMEQVRMEQYNCLPYHIWVRLRQLSPRYQMNLLRKAADFASFAQNMHLMTREPSGKLQFSHLKLRDYCASTYASRRIIAKGTAVRSSAAKVLGKIGDSSALSALLDALKDQHSSVRLSAAVALGNIGDSSVLSVLHDALKDQDKFVRLYAAEALGNIGDPSAISVLFKAMHDQHDSAWHYAYKALSKIEGPSAISALLAAIKDPDRDLRLSAAWTLGNIGDSSALSVLLDALNDQDKFVRSSAAKALGNIGDSSVLSVLHDALKDQDKFVRLYAAEALGNIGDPSAISVLLDAIKDNNSFYAAEALCKIGDPSALPVLLDAIKDQDKFVRRIAAKALVVSFTKF